MCNDHFTSIPRDRRAFTLVELLIVIAVLAILSGGAYLVVSNVRESARVTKLESDVQTVNRAIIAYESNGGSLDGVTRVDDVLAKLKTVSSHRMPGMSGRAIDPRLAATMQTADEAAGNSGRAIYRNRRFEISTDPSDGLGVKEFTLNDAIGAAAPTPENRKSAIRVAEDDSWIWDSQAATPVPRAPGPTPPGAIAGVRTPPTAPGAEPLDEPVINPTESEQPLASFELPVTIDNPNDAELAQIFFSVAGSPMTLYTGQEITVDPGQLVTAYARSNDPDHRDSAAAQKLYTAIPLKLRASVSSPVDRLTYQAAGGKMVGIADAVPPSATISVEPVENIRPKYLSSDNFELVWTSDGSDPLNSPSRETADSFSGGWPPSETVPLGLGNLPLTLNAAVRANTDLFEDSEVETATVEIDPTRLSAPTIDPPSGAFTPGMEATITIVNGTGLPVGYRVFYTTNGVDPGMDDSGNPVNPDAISYTIGQSLSFEAGPVNLIARVYGPPAYAHWFTPSPAAIATYSVGSLAGVLVSKVDSLDGIINGSVQLLTNSSFNWNSGTTINGNLYLPGSPIIVGNKVTSSTTLKVRSGTLPSSPLYKLESNYSYDGSTYNYALVPPSGTAPTHVMRIDGGNITGTIYTKATPNTNGLSQVDATYLNAVLTGSMSGVPAIPTSGNAPNINSNDTVNLAEGNYGNLNVGGTLNLGTPGATSYYNFESLSVNGSGKIVLNGPVVISLKNGGTLNNLIGTTLHPDWLVIYSQGDITVNGGSTGIIGRKIVSTRSVTVNGFVTLTEGVIASGVRVNSSASFTVGLFQQN